MMPVRADYPYITKMTTRWGDNDVYGHLNNVVYYAFFDTAVNRYLIETGAIDVGAGSVIGLVVETSCSYQKPIAFPDDVSAGVRVAKIGNSSVRYEVGIFRNQEEQAAARGHFVHVYVDRKTRRPVSIPSHLRAVLGALAPKGSEEAGETAGASRDEA